VLVSTSAVEVLRYNDRSVKLRLTREVARAGAARLILILALRHAACQ